MKNLKNLNYLFNLSIHSSFTVPKEVPLPWLELICVWIRLDFWAWLTGSNILFSVSTYRMGKEGWARKAHTFL